MNTHQVLCLLPVLLRMTHLLKLSYTVQYISKSWEQKNYPTTDSFATRNPASNWAEHMFFMHLNIVDVLRQEMSEWLFYSSLSCVVVQNESQGVLQSARLSNDS